MLDKLRIILFALFFTLFINNFYGQINKRDSLFSSKESIIDLYIGIGLDSVLFNYYTQLEERGKIDNQFIILNYDVYENKKCIYISMLEYDLDLEVFNKINNVSNPLRYLVERTNRFLNVSNKYLIPVIDNFDLEYCLYNRFPSDGIIIRHSFLIHTLVLIYEIESDSVLGYIGPYDSLLKPINW